MTVVLWADWRMCLFGVSFVPVAPGWSLLTFHAGPFKLQFQHGPTAEHRALIKEALNHENASPDT